MAPPRIKAPLRLQPHMRIHTNRNEWLLAKNQSSAWAAKRSFELLQADSSEFVEFVCGVAVQSYTGLSFSRPRRKPPDAPRSAAPAVRGGARTLRGSRPLLHKKSESRVASGTST